VETQNSVNNQKGVHFMLYIGIDIASKKHDCCILGVLLSSKNGPKMANKNPPQAS
jgi:hypothetical protein